MRGILSKRSKFLGEKVKKERERERERESLLLHLVMLMSCVVVVSSCVCGCLCCFLVDEGATHRSAFVRLQSCQTEDRKSVWGIGRPTNGITESREYTTFPFVLLFRLAMYVRNVVLVRGVSVTLRGRHPIHHYECLPYRRVLRVCANIGHQSRHFVWV